MQIIQLETLIQAPIERCFDLARNIDVHATAASPLNHRAIGGVTSGLINLGETVTWEAWFFGVRQQLTSKIVALDRPLMFTDEMQRGPFKRWRHTHLFESKAGGGTLMTDHVEFASPLWFLGALVDVVFLKTYLTRFLIAHNNDIKSYAEKAASTFAGQSACQ